MKPDRPTPPSDKFRLLAADLLEKGGVLADGWTVANACRRSHKGVEVILTPPFEAKSIAIQWYGNPPDTPLKAFQAGPHSSASYRDGPTLWNIDDVDTPADIRMRAYKACEVLAAHDENLGLWLAPQENGLQLPEDQLDIPLPEDPIDALTILIRHRFTRDLGSVLLPNPEGWRLREVRPFVRWTRVSEIILATEGKSLAFIVSPRDDSRAAFCRTRDYDVVYYSDDLDVAEHAALYARDCETIERVSLWFQAWDQGER